MSTSSPSPRTRRWFLLSPLSALSGCSPRMRVAIVVALAGAAAAVTYSRVYLNQRATERAVAAGWRDYETAAGKTDLEGMEIALDQILSVNPQEPTATRRKAALAAGCADPDDIELAVALVSHHVRHDRLTNAAREARKVLAGRPTHWRSLCVLAHHAMTFDRDPRQAAHWLERLPDPTDPATTVDAGGLLYATRLTEQLGRDPAAIRRAIAQRVLPTVRTGTASSLPLAGKVLFVECYVEAARGDHDLRELMSYWAVVSQGLDSAISDAGAARDSEALARVGLLCPAVCGMLAQARDAGVLPDDRFAALVREVREQSRRCWGRLHELAPTRVEPYCGLALHLAQDGEVRPAVELVLRGLGACGERIELLDLLTRLASATGNAPIAFQVTWVAAERDGTDPAKWLLAARAGLAASAPTERIRAACTNARRLAPDQTATTLVEAQLLLRDGEPRRAVALLALLGEQRIQTEPATVRVHARALAESESVAVVAAFLARVEHATLSSPTNAPPAVVAFHRGLLDAKLGRASAGWVMSRAQEVAARWPADPVVLRVLADAQFRCAELSAPPWNRELAEVALLSYQRLPASSRGDPGVAVALGWLHLRAFRNPGGAARAVAPLRHPANAPLLTAGQREVLAAVALAQGNPSDAIRVLDPVVRGSGVTVGCLVQLALAHQAIGERTAAHAALARSIELPNWSPREVNEWIAAFERLHESP